MPDTKQSAKQDENPRAKLREQRSNRLKLIAEGRQQTVKVFAANETMRRVLRHANGARFRDELSQGVEWPNDSFTKRRIAEGAVRTEAGGESDEQPKADETLNAREQSAARKPKKEKSEHKDEHKESDRSVQHAPRAPSHQPPFPAAS
jgi:hypothetical protein